MRLPGVRAKRALRTPPLSSLTLKARRLPPGEEVNRMTLTVGEVAALAAVPMAAVRYCELRGLIAKAPRTDSGYRPYDADTARPIPDLG